MPRESTLEQVAEQKRRIREMEAYLPQLVVACRIKGHSWSAIGEALGISRQSAWKQYADLVPEAFRED